MQKQRSMIEWRKGQSIGVIQDKRDAFYWVIRLEGFNFVEQDEACISCSLVKDEERYYPAGRYDHWRQGDSVFLILECDLDKDASCLDTLLHRS
ncbi:MAG: hypothetical protein JSS66_06350 [Armatimonadetes bacterium]|nr:hypothetical protein [Armatimonadota bacterium]